MDALDVSFLFGFLTRGLASMFPLVTAEYFGVAAMGSIFGLIFWATVGRNRSGRGWQGSF